MDTFDFLPDILYVNPPGIFSIQDVNVELYQSSNYHFPTSLAKTLTYIFQSHIVEFEYVRHHLPEDNIVSGSVIEQETVPGRSYH